MVFETPALIWILTSSNRIFKLVEITHTHKHTKIQSGQVEIIYARGNML